jgi:hypothetical protein
MLHGLNKFFPHGSFLLGKLMINQLVTKFPAVVGPKGFFLY